MQKQSTIILLCILLTAFSQASAYRIPDTGQTKCYDDKGNEINPCPKPGEPFYGQATRGNIILEMNSFISSTKTDDLIILFLSGHGKNEQSDYYFIAYDTEPDNIIANGLSWLKIINLLRKIPVKVLLLADTCYSGSVVGTDLIPKTDNFMVLSSSSGDMVSREDVSWGHGAFTLALIEGFSGKAFNKDGEMKLYDLYEYVSKRVEMLTQNSQKPEIPEWSNFKKFDSLILGRK